jgi:hypothetical protein
LSRRLGFSFFHFGRRLRLRDLRKSPRKLDQLSRRPVRRRTGRRELILVLFLVGLSCRPLGRELVMVRSPFASKLGLPGRPLPSPCRQLFASGLSGAPCIAMKARDLLARDARKT